MGPFLNARARVVPVGALGAFYYLDWGNETKSHWISSKKLRLIHSHNLPHLG
jgi:hypothetical protein